MKINSIGNLLFATMIACSPIINTSAQTNKSSNKYITDRFEYIVPPSGTNNLDVLKFAPSPMVSIAKVKQKASIVVDLSRNILYTYDKNGKAKEAFRIASGAASSPTETGIRVVSHVENFPYLSAPISTKRRKDPKSYGPNILILEKVDAVTGEKTPTGEFIHGNNNSKSIGKYASHGCIRMDNEVIKKLAQEIKHGAIVLIKR